MEKKVSMKNAAKSGKQRQRVTHPKITHTKTILNAVNMIAAAAIEK